MIGVTPESVARFGSAPFSRSSFVTSALALTAGNNGVAPTSVAAFTSAPASIRWRIAAAAPGMVAAAYKGVRPSAVFASTAAPLRRSSLTFASSATAQCSAVADRVFFALTSAPASTSVCIIATVPLDAACISAVDPAPSDDFARAVSAASSVFTAARSRAVIASIRRCIAALVSRAIGAAPAVRPGMSAPASIHARSTSISCCGNAPVGGI